MVNPMCAPQSARGFTYLVLLWWVLISSVMLMALGHSWGLESRRQKEAELAFRGRQIALALASYAANTPQGQPNLPQTFQELTEDRRSGAVVRHLRRAWPDPMTGQAWGLLLEDGRIRGVYSNAPGQPLAGPEGVITYEQWIFQPATLTSASTNRHVYFVRWAVNLVRHTS